MSRSSWGGHRAFDALEGQPGFERQGAGTYARVAAKLLAAAIWHNWQIGATHKRSLIARDPSESIT